VPTVTHECSAVDLTPGWVTFTSINGVTFEETRYSIPSFHVIAVRWVTAQNDQRHLMPDPNANSVWHSQGHTDEPRDQEIDLGGGWWAAIGPSTEQFWSWDLYDHWNAAPDDTLAEGQADGEDAAKDAALAAYRAAQLDRSGEEPTNSVAAKATELIARKQAGGDCTEDESVWILGYFDAYDPDETPEGQAMSTAYPLEHDQWWRERENGDRPNDTGRDIIRRLAEDDSSGGYAVLACPRCGSQDLDTLEIATCVAECVRISNAGPEFEGTTDYDRGYQRTVGVWCNGCRWSYIVPAWREAWARIESNGSEDEWLAHLVPAQIDRSEAPDA
jgi:hypothetical protein